MKISPLIISILVLLFHADFLSGQKYQMSSSNKKALSYYKEGERAFINREYEAAESLLKKSTQKDDQFIEAWLLLGDVHSDMNKNREAIADFQKALSIDPGFFPRANYFIGRLLVEEGNYDQAIPYLNAYLASDDGLEAARYAALENIKKAEFGQYATAHPSGPEPVNLGPPLNTSNDEYINFVNENQLEITLTRKIPVGMEFQERVVYSEQFYSSVKTGDKWQEPKTFDLPWSSDLNMGAMNLSVDGTKMYFTGCNWPDGFGSCDLYVSFKNGKKWEAPFNLGTVVNSQWWDSQPVASSDGKRIYFSSKRAGGFGGSDIWMTVRLPNGKWSPPVNLGNTINSSGNEMAPFLHADGKTLYFSSDGRIGLGGADLYLSRLDAAGRWSEAVNLGYPINSKDEEINIYLSFDGSTTWISSDREGGYGGFDLYNFATPDKLKPANVFFVKGTVKDKTTGDYLNSVIQLTNLQTGKTDDETVSSAENGTFLMVLHPGTDYAFNISSPGYLFYSANFNLSDSAFQESVEKLFELEAVKPGAKLVLNNIFFDFNSAGLETSSFAELNKLQVFLQDNPEINIRITGHTDSIGDPEYNKQLSTERAESVYLYLLDKGIGKERISFNGAGAEQPVSTNETEEGRAMNRRTEIEIL